MKSTQTDMNDRLQYIETKQIDEKGFVNELVKNMRKENERLHEELNQVHSENASKSNKISAIE